MRGVNRKLLIWAAVLVTSLFTTTALEIFSLEQSPLTPERTFMACGGLASTYTHIAMCNNETEALETWRWNESCSISWIDLNEHLCSSAITIGIQNSQGTVLEKKTITDIKPRRLVANILETQDTDGGWKDPVTTAFHIRVLGDSHQQAVEEALEWLKVNRNDEKKCWPKDACRINDTAMVLHHLYEGGYDTSLRIVLDAQLWINSLQNIIIDEEWDVHIETVANDLSCTMNYDETTTSLEIDEKKTIQITPKYDTVLNLSCDYYFRVMLTDQDYHEIIYQEHSGSDFNTSYRIPEPCFSNKKWDGCNIQTSLYAALTRIESAQKDLLKEFLEQYLRRGTVVGRYLQTHDRILSSALYVGFVDSKPEVLDLLVYSQNNDGSWGTTNRVHHTARSLYALKDKTFPTKTETIRDGKNWLLQNLPEEQSGNDYYIYSALKDEFNEYVVFSPNIIYIEGDITTNVTITNAQNYTLEGINITIENSLKDIIELSAFPDNLEGKTSEELIINQTLEDGTFVGMITIRKGNEQQKVLGKLPVIIVNNPHISLTSEGIAPIFGMSGKIPFSVNKSHSRFTCTIDSDIIYDTVVIDNQETIEVGVALERLARRTIDFEGTFRCISEHGKQIDVPITAEITQYPDVPFTIREDALSLQSRHHSLGFTITNNLHEPITVQIDSGAAIIRTEEEITLQSRERTRVPITHILPEGVDLVHKQNITISAAGYTHKLELVIDVPEIDEPSKILGFIAGMLKLALYLGLFAILAGGAWIGYKKVIKQRPKKKQKKKHIEPTTPSHTPLPQKKKIDHNLLNLVKALDQTLHKDSRKTLEELKEAGISDEELKEFDETPSESTSERKANHSQEEKQKEEKKE